jgi:hypothetical protein
MTPLLVESIYLCSCRCHLEHRTSVKSSFHFSFLFLESRYDSLDGGSARLKAATYTRQHKHRINANVHALSGRRTHDPSVRAGKDSSCLKPRGHCDRLPVECLCLNIAVFLCVCNTSLGFNLYSRI